jgi:N-succinyldiaminopimelate aminotransferase
MNPNLFRLQPYPFEKLASLIAGITPPSDKSPIALSLGEPTHPAPSFLVEEIITHLHGVSAYPTTRGTPALRRTVSEWLVRRFGLKPDSVDADRHVLPVNGTREALFALAQCMVDPRTEPVVMMPNPFYQIYEGAALLAGAEPYYVNCTAETGFLPDFDAVPQHVWKRCQLLYLCSPGNPTGAVLDTAALQGLIEIAEEHEFIIAADECYSEIYREEARPPPGLLAAAAAMGNEDFRRCIVFHSLSKRSSVPGLRSGFVAGDAALIAQFLRYRTYHGCAMPLHTQAASVAAWADERHVAVNRRAYQEKFAAALGILQPVLEAYVPAGAFYLWPETPVDDREFTRALYARENVSVLPGSYLARTAHDINPGRQRVRIALVAPLDECAEAAWRLRNFLAAL